MGEGGEACAEEGGGGGAGGSLSRLDARGQRVHDEEHVDGADAFSQRPGVAAREEVEARVAGGGAAHGLEARDGQDPLED